MRSAGINSSLHKAGLWEGLTTEFSERRSRPLQRQVRRNADSATKRYQASKNEHQKLHYFHEQQLDDRNSCIPEADRCLKLGLRLNRQRIREGVLDPRNPLWL